MDYTEKADLKLAAALLFTSSGVSFQNCLRMARAMTLAERRAAVKKAFQHLEFFDAVLREFEHLYLTYDLIVSAACFGQLKRHRMATITCQRYSPALGVTIPPKIIAGGLEEPFLRVVKKTEEIYASLRKTHPAAAAYVLTNAHQKRVLLTVNARELYHISRLREDAHAQWDIQRLSFQMTKIAKEVMPLTFMLVGGKDAYPEIYQKIFGAVPSQIPPP
jgi:thymidylate synthase ThyX